MNMHLSVSKTFAIAATVVVTAFAGSAHAQLRPKPQDTSGAIDRFDILGVRLGMPEADAVAIIRKQFPEGSRDGRGAPIHLKVSDYLLTNPINHQPVRAGVRFQLHPESPSNFDFVKLFVREGRVWAVWRDDISSTYDYDQMAAAMRSKYAGAHEMEGQFDVIEGSRRTTDGSRGLYGMELYSGACDNLPFNNSTSDSIRLDKACNKTFWISYGHTKTANVRSMGAGSAQLVDLEAGRQFFADMNGLAAAKASADNKRGGEAKL
jgi:hypothetical protein